MLLGGFRLLWHSDYAGGCAALIWSDWKLRLSWSSALVSTWPPRFRQHAGGFMLCCWIVEAMARQCSGTVSYGCLTSDEISLFILADFAADVRMLWLIVMVNRTMTYLCLFFFFCRSMNKNRGQWSAATLEMTSLCRDDSTVLAQNSQVHSKALKLEKANFNDDGIVWTGGGSITWADNRHTTENAIVKCSIVLFETINIHNYCLAKSRWCNMVLLRAFLPFPKAVIGCNI